MTLPVALFLGLLAHMVGDYLLQSDWMAQEKTRRWWPAIVHAVTYGVPFLAITRNPVALAVIIGTHAVIDRYRLARYVVWAKNYLAPRGSALPWSACTDTGYPPNRPLWMTVWLMIIADNVIHVAINSAVIWWAFS